MDEAPETVASGQRPERQYLNDHRRLLALLRDVMAGLGTGQQRLDKIVRLIAAEMKADVCSCYIMRAGDMLELFSTVGLNQAAVHKTRLRVGEGVVGDIAGRARSIALANARAHPNFAYRPETGEEEFESLLGVPILRGGRVRGVLVIQHAQPRQYIEEEVETLQTVAMVVAELLAGGTLVGRQELSNVGNAALLPSRLGGVSLNNGLAIGQAVLHRHQLTIRDMVADNPELELDRLRTALAGMYGAIDALLASTVHGTEHRDILETYRMFAEDRGWLSRIREAVKSGLTAEAAVIQVQNDTRARMNQIADPYIRERLLDLDDLTNRLLRHLAGKKSASDGVAMPDDMILVARTLGPAELLDYDRSKLRGLVLEEGSATSHVVIVARALNIPVVGQCTDALNRVDPFDQVIVDGDNAQVFVRPSEDIKYAVAESMRMMAMRERLFARVRGLPSVSHDGVPVAIQLNCGLLIDLPHLEDSGADGIGLYRTEIPFMIRSTYPDVQTQTVLYAKVLDMAGNKPVVFRTLDVGGDKKLPYFHGHEEANPALGWRAIRIGLDRPAMLRKQLRALMRAAAGRPLSLMFPMVAEVAELRAARRLVDMEIAHTVKAGNAPPDKVRVGVMIEVPALLLQLPSLLPLVDFVSVGSNDLSQYLFAFDRGDPRLSNRYDSLSPPMLGALRLIVEQAAIAGVPLSICGEMAGKPLDAMALVGIGFRSLSMSPPSVGPVKTMLRSLDVARLREYLDSLGRCSDHSIRDRLRAFAKDHSILI